MSAETAGCWKTKGVWGDASCPRLARVGHCRHCPDYMAAGRRLFDRPMPDGLREEWALALASAKQAAPAGTVSLLVFRVRAEWLGLDTPQFQEAALMGPIRRVPTRTNRVFLGLVSVHGELLPCVSVGDLLRLEAGAGPAAPRPSGVAATRFLLVAGDGPERYAFPVEEIHGVARVGADQFSSPPVTVAKFPDAVVQSVFHLDGRPVGRLDSARFMELLRGTVAAAQKPAADRAG